MHKLLELLHSTEAASRPAERGEGGLVLSRHVAEEGHVEPVPWGSLNICFASF